MTLGVEQIRTLTTATPADAWRDIIAGALLVCAAPLSPITAPGEVTKRDRAVGELDRFLSQGAWDLWKDFGAVVERNSDRLAIWWAQPFAAKAILILDGLSLREIPWLVEGAKQRGLPSVRLPPMAPNCRAKPTPSPERSDLVAGASCKTTAAATPIGSRLARRNASICLGRIAAASSTRRRIGCSGINGRTASFMILKTAFGLFPFGEIGHFQWDDPGSTAYRRSPHR